MSTGADKEVLEFFSSLLTPAGSKPETPQTDAVEEDTSDLLQVKQVLRAIRWLIQQKRPRVNMQRQPQKIQKKHQQTLHLKTMKTCQPLRCWHKR